MDLHGMKRQALQSLCKKHGIPANLTNREMADRLALLLKENEKPVDNDQPTDSSNLGEIHCEIESNFTIVNQKVSKKVRFSPENETFIFISSDTESGSDHDYNPKRRLRKRKSVSNLESKKQVQLSKNVKKAEVSAKPLDNSGRVTRSRAQRAVAGDAEIIFSPLAVNKRGRRRVKNVGVYDKPQPIADLGDKDDPREDVKLRGGLIRQGLRSKEVVNEAGDKAGDGDLAVLRKSSRLRGSKNIRNVKASDGVISLDKIHEDNAIAVEEAKPEQILKRSTRIMAKNKGSSSLSKDLGETGIGRRVTRSRKVEEKDSALESEAGSLVVEEESQKVLQLEEPAKGSMRKSVAPQNGKVQSETLACKRNERGQPVKGSRKRSRKTDSEGVSEVEPIVGIVTKGEDLLPNGPPWRSRHSIAPLSSVATAVGELRIQDTDGKKKPQREAPLESDVNIAKPPRRSSRHASKNVGGIADAVRKDLQTKQSKKQILREESSITVHEPLTKKPLRRSRPNVSKSNVTELADPKGTAEKNKPSKARIEITEEEGSYRKCSLSHEEPFMDVVPVCGGSKNDSDLCHRKKVRERANKKRKEGKSVEHSQLGSAEISALDSTKEFTYNTFNSVDQVSESMELEGASIFQQLRDSTAEVVDTEKENIVEEARMENLNLVNKLEGAMEYHSCHSFNTRTESGDENLVEHVSREQVEHPSNVNNVVSCGIISPASGFSPAYQEDSHGLKTEESSMQKYVNPVNDKVNDLLADNGRANAQEDKMILELDANGNYEPYQEETIQENQLSELTGSRDFERSSEKFSNEAEKIHVLVPYDRNEAEEAVQENHLSELSGSRESERSSEKFSNEAEKICVLVPYERHGIAQVDEYAAETADIGVEKVADIQLEIAQDGNQLETLPAMHPEIVGRRDAYHVERENCPNNLIEVPDETIFSEDSSFSKLRGQVCSNERTEGIGMMNEKDSSEYGDGRTPNEIVATVSHVGEFSFGSSEKRGEVLPERSESCLSCGGKTANKEENVGKSVDDPKPQAISFDAETKDNVDGVNEDDVNDHLVEKELQTMYPFTSIHEVGTKEAAEINCCSPAAVEETEAETIEKRGLEEMLKNGEEKEEHVATDKVTEMEEAENGAPMLPLYSMGDDTAFSKYEIELSKTNDLAQGASDVTMSSEYEDGGTPNEIVATVSQVGEFNFGSSAKQGEVLPDPDKTASTYSESCLSCVGKTANKEENVGKAVEDPKAQVISFDTETKDNVDGVTEDDVNHHLVGKELQTKYLFTSVHEVGTKEAAEINSCSPAVVEEMEAESIEKHGLEEMSINGEDKKEHVITNKVTEREEAENGAPMLPLYSMGDDTAFSRYEIELSKTNVLAQGASDVTVSSEYEDGGTPNEIVATVSQVGEFNFGSSAKQGEVLPDLDKTASMYSESCLSCVDKTANKEENVGKAVEDPKAQVIRFDGETKDSIDGVTEDDVNDHLVEKESETMYPFASTHDVGAKEAVEINSCSPAAVEEIEAESIDKCGHEEMSKNGEKREEHAVTNKVTKMEEAENGTPMLPLDSMWDDTALSKFENELSKSNRLALGASDVTMSSEYEDGGTPNEIVATVSQVGEFSFGSSEKQVEVLPDLDKSASIFSESCLSCGGKTANKEENIGKAVDDPKGQVISFHAEIKEYVVGVTENDVDDHLVERKLETMYPFTSMHEVMTKEAVEINSRSLASVDDVDGTEAQRIGKFGPEEMSKIGEDNEELVMTDKMEEAENGTAMLPLDSMVDDTAFSKYETELSKTIGLALGALDLTMSSEYKDGGTPNKIVATVSQVGEFNFGSSEKQGEVLPDRGKSASIYSESYLSCDGITANKEEDVGKAVVDPKAHVISSDAETTENVDGVTEDDVTDHLVEKEFLEQNDNDPDLTLRNTHESCIYATDESDDILDRRIGIETIEDGTKLDEQLISPFRLNNGCLSDEKKSGVVKSFSVTPSGRNVYGSSTATFSVQNFSLSRGKEYEFHAYSNRVRNYAEGIEMANEDKGFGHETVNPSVQGENELGIDKRLEGQNSNKGTNDSTDGFAVENNARTSQVVAEKLDGYADVSKLGSQMDSDDDLDLSNLFNSNSTYSKRNSKETGEEINLHDLDNLAISSGQSNEFSDCGNNAAILKPEMNLECSVVSPATASTTENNKVLEIAAEMAFSTSYELNLSSEDRERDEFKEADVRTLKDKLITNNSEEVNEGREIVSSIENFEKEQHCDYEQSTVEEVIMLKHTQLIAADEPNLINETNKVSEGREIVGSVVSNFELNEGREHVESIGKDGDDEHGIVEEFEIGKQNQLSASDESIYENRSIPKEKGGVPVIKQGLADCEIHKFESIEFENYTESTQINASNYAASDTSRAECCASDSKKPEIHVNSAVEAVASKNPQKLESREDKSPEAKLMERISRSAMPKTKTNKDFSIPRTPKNIHKIYDMKENFPSGKREQVNNMTATKTSVKRRALEDLQKN